MSKPDVFERVEIVLGTSDDLIVFNVTHDLAARAASALREWTPASDEDVILRQFTVLAAELKGDQTYEILGGETLRAAGHALREVIKEKVFTEQERRALMVACRHHWRESQRKGRTISFEPSPAHATRIATAFRALAKTANYDAFDFAFCSLYTEIFGPLHDVAKHEALFGYGLHTLSSSERKKFSRALARKPTSRAETDAITLSLRNPCETCAYLHAALIPPDGCMPEDRCQCPCHSLAPREAEG